MGLLSYFKGIIESSERMDRMMKTLEVNESFADLSNGAAVLRRASRRCHGCEQPDACESWLDSHTEASEAPSFCKNRELFSRLHDQIEAERH